MVDINTTFHIQDLKTGLFYNKYAFHGHDCNPPCSIEYAAKGFGKPFKTIGKVKTHILYLIGIMEPPESIKKLELDILHIARRCRLQNIKPENDLEYQQAQRTLENWYFLHPTYKTVPDFMGNPYPIDEIPESWHLVKLLDKKNKKLQNVNFNLRDYAVRAQKLRRLTDNYGSAVRDIYNKLEKSEKIEEYPWVVAIMLNPSMVQQQQIITWENITIDLDSINLVLNRMDLEKNSMIKSSKKESIAMAFKNLNHAIYFKLNYNGPDQIGILNTTDLTELVNIDEHGHVI